MSDPYDAGDTPWIRRQKNDLKVCEHDPQKTTGPIGMYHCPVCGEMVIAGMPHHDYSKLEKSDNVE